MTRSNWMLLGVAAALAACAPTQPKVTFYQPELRSRLDNGLRMVILPDKTTSLVQVDVRYEVGSKEDPPGKAGLAHLVEHMMFQHRFGPPETPIEQRPPTFQILPHVTVGLNAYTNWDTTHYWLRAPKEDLETLLRIEAARMAAGCDNIPQAEFEREREVVRNEIRWRTGEPEGQQLQAILSNVYPEGHAYRNMIGGNDEQLTTITFDDVCEFMKDYYVPRRATVIVTGAVDHEQAGRLIKHYFGGVENRAPAPLREVAPLQLKNKKVELSYDIERDTVYVIFALPPQNSDEWEPSLRMIFLLTGMLNRLAADWNFGDVGIQQLGGAYAPIMAVSVELYPGKDPGEALDYIWKALGYARRNTGVMLDEGSYATEEETKARQKQERISQLEALAVRANAVAEMIQFDKKVEFSGEGAYIGELLARIDRVDESQYKSFVKRILDKDKAVVITVRASEQGKKGDKRSKLAFSARSHDERPDPPVDPREAKKPLKAPQSNSVLVDARRYTLSNGMNVVLLPYKGLPIVHAELVFGVGSGHEPADQAGLAATAADFLRFPAGADAYARTGVSIRKSAGPDSTTLVARGLNIYLDVIIKGLERIIRAGDIDQEQIEESQEQFGKFFSRDAFQRDRAYRHELAKALYGTSHPYVTRGWRTPETFGRIGRDTAIAFIRKHYSANNGTLIVVGNFDPAKAKSIISDSFGGWSGGHKDDVVTAQIPARSQPEYIGVYDRDGAQQVDITIAYPAPAGIDGQRAARLVLAAMLNERMKLVREQLGSSYGVGATRTTRRGPTAYVMGGAIDAARAGETLRFMREQVDALRRGEGFERDFVIARRLVLKQLLGESTESYALAARLAAIAEYELDPDYYDKLIRYVAAVSPAQVKALLAQELDPSKEVIAALGDRARLEAAFAEAGLANVRYLDPTAAK